MMSTTPLGSRDGGTLVRVKSGRDEDASDAVANGDGAAADRDRGQV